MVLSLCPLVSSHEQTQGMAVYHALKDEAYLLHSSARSPALIDPSDLSTQVTLASI